MESITKKDILNLFQLHQKCSYPQVRLSFYKSLRDGAAYIEKEIINARQEASEILAQNPEFVDEYNEKINDFRASAYRNMYLLSITEILLRYNEKVAYRLFQDIKDDNPFPNELSNDFIAQCAMYGKTFFTNLNIDDFPAFTYPAVYDDIKRKRQELESFIPESERSEDLKMHLFLASIIDISNPIYNRDAAMNIAMEEQYIYLIGYFREFTPIISQALTNIHIADAKKIISFSEKYAPDSDAALTRLEESGYSPDEIKAAYIEINNIIPSPEECQEL